MRNLWLFFLLGFVGCVKGHCVPFPKINEILNQGAERCHGDIISTVCNSVGLGGLLGTLHAVNLAGDVSVYINIGPKPGSNNILLCGVGIIVGVKVGTLAKCSALINATVEVDVTINGKCITFIPRMITSCTVALNGQEVQLLGALLAPVLTVLNAGITPVVNALITKLFFGVGMRLDAVFGIIVINGEPCSCSVQNIIVGPIGLIVDLATILSSGTAVVLSAVSGLTATAGQASLFAITSTVVQTAITSALSFPTVTLPAENCLVFGVPAGAVLFLRIALSQPPKCHFTEGSDLSVDLALSIFVRSTQQEIYAVNANLTLKASFQSLANCFGLKVNFLLGLSLSGASFDICGCEINSTRIEGIIKANIQLAVDSLKCGLGCLTSVPSFPGPGTKPPNCGYSEGNKHVCCG